MPLLCDPIYVSLHLVSESNMREHWATKSRRARQQRRAVYVTLRGVYWPPPPLPLTITLTRIAPRELDTDNCVACFKHAQDGVADWLAGAQGKGEDRQRGLAFQYGQHKGKPKEYAVKIAIYSETY